MVDINIEWGWILAGFIIGISCSCLVSDLVFPLGDKDEE